MMAAAPPMIPVLTTIPRSGTHYLKSLISAALGIPPLEKDFERSPEGLRAALSALPGSQLIYGHFRFSLHGGVLDEKLVPGLRMVILTRHPLDRLISQVAFQKASGQQLPDPEHSPQRIVRDEMLGKWDGNELRSDGTVVEDCAAWENFLLRDFVTDWLDNRNCHLVKFEDLISTPIEVLIECLAFFRVTLPREEIVKITEAINFTTLSGGRSPGQVDPTSHYRRGIAGEWREVFSAADIDVLRRKCADVFRKSGYDL